MTQILKNSSRISTATPPWLRPGTVGAQTRSAAASVDADNNRSAASAPEMDWSEVVLATGTMLFPRAGGGIQFGLDSTQGGMLSGLNPTAVPLLIDAFEKARTAIPEKQLHADLVAAGLLPCTATLLLSDLITRKILHQVPPTSPAIAVVGEGLLAQEIAHQLIQSGVRVSRRLPYESIPRFLAGNGGSLPVILTDWMLLEPHLLTNSHRTLWLPATIVDGCGWVGPVSPASSGPCLVCFIKHCQDHDPEFTTLLERMRARKPQEEKLSAPVVAATAARVSAMALAVLGHTAGLGFSDLPQPKAGALDCVKAGGLEVATSNVNAHPRCPRCIRKPA